MRRKILFFVLFFSISFTLAADEGMWLPSEIKLRIADMQKKGFKLSAEDIYSINKSSLKDAIVHFDGGCTGEMISDKGLLITNHHCGFDEIQAHSTVEHDYLKNGFWAMKMSDELPNPGLKVSFLEYMKDVTKQVLSGYKKGMSEAQRAEIIKKNSDALIQGIEKEGKGLSAKVSPLYYGNQYFLFVYKVFTDVRLVGAPPSSIGKFGGDTDNWMWPRHTGDFSLFRVYADKDNEPADYSPDNVPYKPKKSFAINAAGIEEGDFTLVYGFPGRTNEYLMSDAVKYIAEISNPEKIKLRTLRLEVQKREMEKNNAVRIQYAAKNASVANAWKKWQGEMNGIRKMNTVENKKEYERRFTAWAKGKPEYEGIIEKFASLYAQIRDLSLVSDYQKEALNAVELLSFAGKTAPQDTAAFYKDYYQPIDKDIFIALFKEYDKAIPAAYKSPYFKNTLDRMGSVEVWADSVYDGTLQRAGEIYRNTNGYFDTVLKPRLDSLNDEITLLYRTYMKGQMKYNKAMRGSRVFYPDANSTLRVAYGEVKGYSPADAVYYTPVSTLEGILQKDNPAVYDYDIPQKLRDLYAARDFGRWEVNGTVPVAFIATNHTSGGNSGSPVLDAEGHLIGVNFDRVWEGTMSDVVFDPDVCRNIALDIRYALFVIDKLAGAQHLIEEMTILR